MVTPIVEKTGITTVPHQTARNPSPVIAATQSPNLAKIAFGHSCEQFSRKPWPRPRNVQTVTLTAPNGSLEARVRPQLAHGHRCQHQLMAHNCWQVVANPARLAGLEKASEVRRGITKLGRRRSLRRRGTALRISRQPRQRLPLSVHPDRRWRSIAPPSDRVHAHERWP